jgi:hypothetical protein
MYLVELNVMANDIFISYSRKDSDFIKSLVEELKSQGIDPWYDEEDIPKASLWENEMLLGVQRCFDFLFIISPDSIQSKPCFIELEEALRLNKRIIPGLLRSVDGYGDFIHPALTSLNWLRFDRDVLKANRELIGLINSPRGWMGDLVKRPSAILQIHYYDGGTLEFPLIQDCYWVGRRPNPPRGRAGAIALPDPNPNSPITSRFHFELVVQGSQWYAFNKSRNGTILYPPSPSGLVQNEMKIFAGHSWMIYREVKLPSEAKEDNFKDTYTGEK